MEISLKCNKIVDFSFPRDKWKGRKETCRKWKNNRKFNSISQPQLCCRYKTRVPAEHSYPSNETIVWVFHKKKTSLIQVFVWREHELNKINFYFFPFIVFIYFLRILKVSSRQKIKMNGKEIASNWTHHINSVDILFVFHWHMMEHTLFSCDVTQIDTRVLCVWKAYKCWIQWALLSCNRLPYCCFHSKNSTFFSFDGCKASLAYYILSYTVAPLSRTSSTLSTVTSIIIIIMIMFYFLSVTVN